jgi:hypothetical protein
VNRKIKLAAPLARQVAKYQLGLMVSTEPMLPVLTAQIPETLDVLPGVGELIIGIEPSLTFLLQRVSPEV